MKERLQELCGLDENQLQNRSPLFWPETFSKTTPLLIMHGAADWRVSPLDSLELSVKLLEQSVPHRLILFEGADHGITEFHRIVMQHIEHWFERFLKEDGPLPQTAPHGR